MKKAGAVFLRPCPLFSNASQMETVAVSGDTFSLFCLSSISADIVLCGCESAPSPPLGVSGRALSFLKRSFKRMGQRREEITTSIITGTTGSIIVGPPTELSPDGRSDQKSCDHGADHLRQAELAHEHSQKFCCEQNDCQIPKYFRDIHNISFSAT